MTCIRPKILENLKEFWLIKKVILKDNKTEVKLKLWQLEYHNRRDQIFCLDFFHKSQINKVE